MRVNLRRVVEMAPGLAGAQVDNDDPIAAFSGGVCDVGNASTRRGNVGAEIEANIVQILCIVSVLSRRIPQNSQRTESG